MSPTMRNSTHSIEFYDSLLIVYICRYIGSMYIHRYQLPKFCLPQTLGLWKALDMTRSAFTTTTPALYQARSFLIVYEFFLSQCWLQLTVVDLAPNFQLPLFVARLFRIKLHICNPFQVQAA
jgi:hypothetical protein